MVECKRRHLYELQAELSGWILRDVMLSRFAEDHPIRQIHAIRIVAEDSMPEIQVFYPACFAVTQLKID